MSTELLNFDSRGWLGTFTAAPTLKEVSYRGPLGNVKADLYFPTPGRKVSGVLLNHGVIDTGKDDPRLKRFAGILCRAGFAVFVPDFQGMRSFRISPKDADEIQAAFENFMSLGGDRAGFVRSFRFQLRGGADDHCRVPARDPAEGPVCSFFRRILRPEECSYLATGYFDFGGKKYYREPQEYGKWVFLANIWTWSDLPGPGGPPPYPGGETAGRKSCHRPVPSSAGGRGKKYFGSFVPRRSRGDGEHFSGDSPLPSVLR